MQQCSGFLNSTLESLASFTSFSILTVTILFVLWSDELCFAHSNFPFSVELQGKQLPFEVTELHLSLSSLLQNCLMALWKSRAALQGC